VREIEPPDVNIPEEESGYSNPKESSREEDQIMSYNDRPHSRSMHSTEGGNASRKQNEGALVEAASRTAGLAPTLVH